MVAGVGNVDVPPRSRVTAYGVCVVIAAAVKLPVTRLFVALRRISRHCLLNSCVHGVDVDGAQSVVLFLTPDRVAG